ncbi:Cytosine-specific methyltransferase [Novosphingobium resinovorum]|uniref:Cytosine-specific methyltransferase n=1 Tax=Novosphingobium resinovorum TaxID=158500 RepID=A0A031J2H6_9SPHN|nr:MULTISPECIES: DNA cytosine methyltransferase [Novosphingobium]EZP68029.1 Cytosine-specific methyltransferase [Novosphingobium resinovorum]
MFKTISLFSGIGGLDFGFEEAGFETRVALEFDRHACRTIRLNRDWSVIEDDINKVSSETLLAQAGLEPGEADILIGGPPCQPFSKSSYWARGDALRLDDPRADTLTGYLRILRDTRPRAFLLENVYGLAYEGKDEGLRYILDGIAQINRDVGTNYQVSWQMVNTAQHGVPQARERVFMIGSRDGQVFRFPEPTHLPPDRLDQTLFGSAEPYRTAWDALGDLPEPDTDEPGLKVGGKWGDLLPTIPEGENYLWHTDRSGGHPLFGWRTRYWSFLLKLSKRLPSWTIQAQPGAAIGPFHWNNRRLTFAELCRIQTFPDGLRMESGRTEMQRMLGNAVPSLVAEVLAREIRRQFFGAALNTPLKLLAPRRENVPAPKATSSLPEKYQDMIGTHAAHPGTGKGRQALKRAEAALSVAAE